MKNQISVFIIKKKWYIYALALIAVIVFPFVFESRYILRLGTLVLMYLILTFSLNLLTGYLGQMSFGHAAFFGIGAYTSALFATKLGIGSEVSFIVAILLAGIFGLLIGLPVLKLSGAYLTLVTLGFCEIIRLVEINWVDLTRGPLGITSIPKPSFLGLEISSYRGIYLLALVLLLITLFVITRLINSKMGRAIIAIRDDTLAASVMGVNVFKYKVMVFIISSMIAGLAGAFFSQYMVYIDPSSFTSSASIEMLIMVILGGLGNNVGTVIGTIVILLLPEIMRPLMEYRMLLYGVMIVLVMILKPCGLLGDVNFKHIEDRVKADKDDKIKLKNLVGARNRKNVK